MGGKRLVSYAAIISEYNRIECLSAERKRFRTQRDLGSAIELAALAITSDGQKHRHQWRIGNAAMKRASEMLASGAAALASASSFDMLHDRVGALVGAIHGIGKLYVYDIAFRIGAYLGLDPDRVYLHAGTRTGAKNLGLNVRRRRHLDVAEIVMAVPRRRTGSGW